MIWNGDRIMDSYRRQYAVLVGIAGESLAAQQRSLIGTMGPPRSTPGNPPHVDTGVLQESVQSIDVTASDDSPTASVGSSIGYSRLLERGTRRMAPRPWCLRSLKEGKETIRRNLIGH